MREIKFRAWCIASKKMFEWDEMYGITRTENPNSVAVHLAFGDQCYLLPEEMHLMQFTGHFDVNGKEVYEGDIVRWANLPKVRRRWRVDYLDNESVFFATSLDGYSGGPLWSIASQGGIEVVGHMYENE